MRTVYQTNNRPFSLLIRGVTASRWHHVGLEIDGVVYEARARGGVVRTSLDEFRSRGKCHISKYETDSKSAQVAKDFLESQVGKPYDWFGALGFPFRASWQNENKWYCSELVAAAYKVAGYPIVRDDLLGVSPRDLWVLKPKYDGWE